MNVHQLLRLFKRTREGLEQSDLQSCVQVCLIGFSFAFPHHSIGDCGSYGIQSPCWAQLAPVPLSAQQFVSFVSFELAFYMTLSPKKRSWCALNAMNLMSCQFSGGKIVMWRISILLCLNLQEYIRSIDVTLEGFIQQLHPAQRISWHRTVKVPYLSRPAELLCSTGSHKRYPNSLAHPKVPSLLHIAIPVFL